MNERIKRFIRLPMTEKKDKIMRHILRRTALLKRKEVYIPNGYAKDAEVVYEGPKVSVLMPVYNHAEVVERALESIISQTYKNIEIIVLDDGSTDGLQNILNKYKKYEQIKIYKQKNQKLPCALTHLHELATGELLTWTSADNAMHPFMIEVLVSKLLEHPEASLVYGDVTVIDIKDKAYYGPCRDVERDFRTPKIIRLQRNENPLSIGNDNYINASFLYRAEASDVLLGVYANDTIGAEDYDFWLRLQKTGKLIHIKEEKPFYFYRVHDNTMSHEIETKKIEKHRYNLKLLQEYEQERIKWCNLRAVVKLDDSLGEQKKRELSELIEKLPVDNYEKIRDDNPEKLITISAQPESASDVFIKVEEDEYVLFDNKIKRKVVSIFNGVDIPRESYRARNLYSHSYYADRITGVTKPVFGCHIDSTDILFESFDELIINNQDKFFVVIDVNSSDEFKRRENKYVNFVYLPNMPFGISYEYYSNFARVIALESKGIGNKMMGIMLAYAIGRKLSYVEDNFYQKFPYTIPSHTASIRFTCADGIHDRDYEVMDSYIREYSRQQRLRKIIDYYNAHTQEMYIKRPPFIVDFIPEDVKPTIVM